MIEGIAKNEAGEPIILYELDDETGIATIKMNRPEKRNALSPALIEALKAAFKKAEEDDRVRVILLNGAGKDFCAGADLAHLESTLDWNHDELVEDAMQLGNLFIQMRELPKPIVASVHRNALAGGCGLATACDFVFASEEARFGYPEIHIGFIPAMVMTMLVRSVGEKQAYDLVATGRRISSTEAKQSGLITGVLSDEELEDGSDRFCRDLAAKSPTALASEKALLMEHTAKFEEAIRRAADVNARVRTSYEARRGIGAFLESRKERATE